MTTNKLRFVDTGGEGKSITERKTSLRAYMRARRGENENRDAKEDALVCNVWSVIESLSLRKNKELSVFVYLSFSSEAPTDKLIECLLAQGITVYAPLIAGKEMQAVRIGGELDFSLSAWGIREPVGEPFDGEVDVVILPLLAVDEQGNRLGYGKGYYDRYLRRHPKTLRIGYAFDFQVLPSVPHEACDESLDIIVTDRRIIHTHVRDE